MSHQALLSHPLSLSLQPFRPLTKNAFPDSHGVSRRPGHNRAMPAKPPPETRTEDGRPVRAHTRDRTTAVESLPAPRRRRRRRRRLSERPLLGGIREERRGKERREGAGYAPRTKILSRGGRLEEATMRLRLLSPSSAAAESSRKRPGEMIIWFHEQAVEKRTSKPLLYS